MVTLLCGSVGAQQPGTPWAIRGATVIDGTGTPAGAGFVILGVGERIACVGSEQACPIPGGASVITAAGKWVVPGLIDTHVHLNWSDAGGAARAQLVRFAFGITTTREAGTPGQLEANLSRRGPASLATAPEPRLVVSALVSEENEQTYRKNGAATLTRRLIALGADAIKIKREFDAEDLGSIVSEAHASGLPVFGHTWGPRGSNLGAALAAGIDGLAHMTTFSSFGDIGASARQTAPDGIDYWVWTREQWNHQDETRLASARDLVVQLGVWVEPMLVTEKYFTLPYPVPEDARYLAAVPSVRQLVRPWVPIGSSGWPALRERRRRIEAVYDHMCEFVKRFHAQGGIVVTGTDDVEPGPALAEEVRLLRGCGLSAMAALRAATQQAAGALGRADVGTVETGNLADLVILDADPLADPENLRRVWRVVKGGHVYNPAVLLGPMIEWHQDQRRSTWLSRALVAALLFTAAASVLWWRRRSQSRGRLR